MACSIGWTSPFWFLIFPSPLRLGWESDPHRKQVSSHDENSAIAAAPTLVSPDSNRAWPWLSKKLHLLPLPRVVPAGMEPRSQDKVCCPLMAFSTVYHIYKTDLNKKDLVQPSPRSRLRVCIPPTPHCGVQTRNHPCCITVKHIQSPAFVSFQACLQRKGEEKAEWVMSLKPERGDIF